MTQQRTPLLLLALLLTTIGCGSGPGAPVDTIDPNAPPPTSDRQPAIGNQNPVNPSSLPPDNSQAPGSSGQPPDDDGSGSCVELCNTLPSRGCALPPDGCVQSCAELQAEPCGQQLLALNQCALAVACPEDLEEAELEVVQAIVARCPVQYQAFSACEDSSGNND